MSAKQKTRYVCNSCGHEEARWLGRCPACGAWNTLEEEPVVGSAPAARPGRSGRAGRAGANSGAVGTPSHSRARAGDSIQAGEGSSTAHSGGRGKAVELRSLQGTELERLPSGMPELDRVLGGGMVPGSSVLVGGEPGIGKSTLMIQVAARFGSEALYVSGEESAPQIKMRADRLGIGGSGMRILCSDELETITAEISRRRPKLIVIDSVQTLFSPDAGNVPGTVNQIKLCSYELADWARELGAVIYLVAHVTKEGAIAGPKHLEHLVDAVLYFEQADGDVRFVRSSKNRFGALDEVGIFMMQQTGLMQVKDPASLFLVEREGELPPGVVVAPVYEGSRVLMVELQALTVPAKSGVSRTFSDKVNSGRVSRIAAVLEKHAGTAFSDQDLYVNVAGGMKIDEVGIDLPLAVALYSARTGKAAPAATAICGELSLAGEVRPVARLAGRIRAATDMGFGRIIGPRALREGEQREGNWTGVRRLTDALRALWG